MQMPTELCAAMATTSSVKNGPNIAWLWTIGARCPRHNGEKLSKPAFDYREFRLRPVVMFRLLCQRHLEAARSRISKSVPRWIVRHQSSRRLHVTSNQTRTQTSSKLWDCNRAIYVMDCQLALYKSLVRPHLEYCTAACSPHYSKDKDILERIQHRFSRMVPGLKTPYEQLLIVTFMDFGRKKGSCGFDWSLQNGEWYFWYILW